MKIYAPVKTINGVHASIQFVNGVGETNNPALIEWFKKHGYRVEKSEETTVEVVEESVTPTEEVKVSDEPDFEEMTNNELRDWMRENGYGGKIKNTRDKEKLLKILRG